MDTLIEDLTTAAEEAVEQAAAEAARAAMLASLDREMSLLRAKALAVRETRRLLEENGVLRKSRVKAAVITGAICFFTGLAAGACGVMLIGGIQ